MSKPELLFISPVLPHPTGNGRAMRAYAHVSALSPCYAVHLLVTDPAWAPVKSTIPVSRLCRRVVGLPFLPGKDYPLSVKWKISRLLFGLKGALPFEWLSATPERRKRAVRLFSGHKFSVVHAYRLYSKPYADVFWEEGRAEHGQVDIDDIESETRKRLSDLYRRAGNRRMAYQAAYEARFYRAIERKTLAECGRVFVCSSSDAERMGRDYPRARVEVLPNVVPSGSRKEKNTPGSPFTFIFVGSLGYYPNEDGILFFADRVLPLLRAKSPLPFVVRVVGKGLSAKQSARLAAIPEVEIAGWVEGVSSCYKGSDAAIIPIRAGGGTRIKALEAFAHGVPVVSTSLGLEGLPVEDETHVLVGDSEDTLAERCSRIMIDHELRLRLIEHAFSLVQSAFHPGVVRDVLCGKSTSNC